MEVLWTFPRLFVICLCMQEVLTKFCHECQSQSVPECGSPFMLTSSQHVTKCSSSCYKFAVMKDERAVVTRGCLPIMKTYERCRTDRIGTLYGAMCTCNTNYCNPATGPLGSYISLVLTTMIVHLFC